MEGVGMRSKGAIFFLVCLFCLGLLSGCLERPEALDIELGPSLNATLADPLLLTVAANRRRSEYMIDEGYTLARDMEGVLAFKTDTSGDLGLAFNMAGRWMVSEKDYHSPIVITFTASDALVYTFGLTKDIAVEIRFLAVTSKVAALQVVIDNKSEEARTVTLLPWLKRCEAPYTQPGPVSGGLVAAHHTDMPIEVQIFAPETFVEDFSNGLVSFEAEVVALGLPDCGASKINDVIRLSQATGLPPDKSAFLALKHSVTVPPASRRAVRYYRGVVDAAKAGTLGQELDSAKSVSLNQVLLQGLARLERIPVLDNLTRKQRLVFRSSFVLLEQLMMPAEGKLNHDYYLFSREPTWWFGRLGQHIHESLSMILMAHYDPLSAMESQRVFIDRIEADGYLPYNIGPVVEQTRLRTASAPLFSYVSWEIYRITQDFEFLTQAYETGKLLHRFYVEQRDADNDGLCEWGGYGITESVRDLENVIWEHVAKPHEVEALGLNCMLVKEAQSLALMADTLGKTGEANTWRQTAATRADLINRILWDEETGFYYHAARDSNTFDFNQPNDLKRMEISGFLPLWAGIVSAERLPILLGKLTDPALFWRTNGVPGLAANDPYYSADADRCCRWRGPVWVQWQFLLMRALLEHNRRDLAVQITRRTYRGVEEQLSLVNQFRELYNPDDAQAVNNSMPNYIWSAMVALMMIEMKGL